jgi:hypothetical protein
MSMKAIFVNTQDNTEKTIEYSKHGTVIPRIGDFVVSPFDNEKIAYVGDVTGRGEALLIYVWEGDEGATSGGSF